MHLQGFEETEDGELKKVDWKHTSAQALISRMMRLRSGVLEDVLTDFSNITIEEIANHNVVLDLSEIQVRGTQEQMKLLMNFILRLIVDYYRLQERDTVKSQLKHIIINCS